MSNLKRSVQGLSNILNTGSLVKRISNHAITLSKNNNHFQNLYSRKFSSALSTHVDSDLNNESTPFDFTLESYDTIKKIIAKYPPNYHRGATIPLLDLAQRQAGGWLPLSAMNKVAKVLDLPPIYIYEVASFYTMFNRNPIGKHHVQVCTTTPCMLRDAYNILDVCKKNLGIDVGETTKDGMFTLGEVECAGACVNAPVMSIGDDYYEDLTEDSTNKILNAFKKGEKPKIGSQTGRMSSEFAPKKKTTLNEEPTGPYIRPDF